MKRTIALFAGIALVLMAGCGDKLPTDIPDVIGYNGIVAQGWQAYDQGDYNTAMQKFQEALDIDVTRPDAFLGAGWTSVHLTDYWNVGGEYFYMAAQQDAGGKWPVTSGTAVAEQDPGWTVFECVDPVLSPSTMSVLEAYGEVWTDWPKDGDVTVIENQIIGRFLRGTGPFADAHNDPQSPKYGTIPFLYKFTYGVPNFFGIISAENVTTPVASGMEVVDLLEEGGVMYAYLHVPHTNSADGEYDYWIMTEHNIEFDYATFHMPSGATDFTRHALAGYAALQQARGLSGNAVAGVAAAFGLYLQGEYSFSHSSMNRTNILGMSAAMAFLQQQFRFTLFTVQTAGFGMGLNPDSPNFVIQLAQTIQAMLNF